MRMLVLLFVTTHFWSSVSGGELADSVRERKPQKVTVGLELEPSRQEIGLGTVYARKSNTRVLEIQNTTKSPLSLKSVEFSCGCMKGYATRPDAGPGEFLSISMEVSIRKDIDSVEQSMVLVFKTGEISRKEFTIRAAVVSDVTVRPRTISFSEEKQSETIHILIRDKTLALTSLTALSGNILVDEVSGGVVSDDGIAYAVDVRCATTFGQAIEVLRAKFRHSDGNEVRDLTVGVASPSRHRFLPSVLEYASFGEAGETKVLLVFPSSFVPEEGAQFAAESVDARGNRRSLPDELFTYRRIAERVLEIMFV